MPAESSTHDSHFSSHSGPRAAPRATGVTPRHRDLALGRWLLSRLGRRTDDDRSARLTPRLAPRDSACGSAVTVTIRHHYQCHGFPSGHSTRAAVDSLNFLALSHDSPLAPRWRALVMMGAIVRKVRHAAACDC